MITKSWEEDWQTDLQHFIKKQHQTRNISNEYHFQSNNDYIVYTMIKYVIELEERFAELEERFAELEDRHNRVLTQHTNGQSSESLSDLVDLFGIDPNTPFDPQDLEGILSEYSDDLSSMEWVRSVRDDI